MVKSGKEVGETKDIIENKVEMLSSNRNLASEKILEKQDWLNTDLNEESKTEEDIHVEKEEDGKIHIKKIEEMKSTCEKRGNSLIKTKIIRNHRGNPEESFHEERNKSSIKKNELNSHKRKPEGKPCNERNKSLSDKDELNNHIQILKKKPTEIQQETITKKKHESHVKQEEFIPTRIIYKTDHNNNISENNKTFKRVDTFKQVDTVVQNDFKNEDKVKKLNQKSSKRNHQKQKALLTRMQWLLLYMGGIIMSSILVLNSAKICSNISTLSHSNRITNIMNKMITLPRFNPDSTLNQAERHENLRHLLARRSGEFWIKEGQSKNGKLRGNKKITYNYEAIIENHLNSLEDQQDNLDKRVRDLRWVNTANNIYKEARTKFKEITMLQIFGVQKVTEIAQAEKELGCSTDWSMSIEQIRINEEMVKWKKLKRETKNRRREEEGGEETADEVSTNEVEVKTDLDGTVKNGEIPSNLRRPFSIPVHFQEKEDTKNQAANRFWMLDVLDDAKEESLTKCNKKWCSPWKCGEQWLNHVQQDPEL